MRVLTYIAVGCAFFVVGALYQAAMNQPNVEIRRVQAPVQAADVIQCDKHGLEEYLRVCRGRKRSTLTL